MSFHLSFHTASLGPTGAYWLDDPSDLSCKEATRQHTLDDPRLSCKQLVTAAYLAVVFTQLAFVGHDAGHHQLFRSRRAAAPFVR